MFGPSPTPLRLFTPPVGVPSGTRPRAIATTTAIEATELYGTSAPAGTAGHQRLRVLLPTTWTSAPPGSLRRIASAVHTVFRCVASRNTQRVFYWGALRLISNRACRAQPVQAERRGRDLPMTADATSGGRPVPLGTRKLQRVAASGERNEHRRVASPRPGWRRRAHSVGVQIPGLLTNSRPPAPTQLRPTVMDRAPGDSFYFAISKIVESLLRRGAQVSLGRRTGPPLPEAEDGDSANRDELCKTSPPRNQPQA